MENSRPVPQVDKGAEADALARHSRGEGPAPRFGGNHVPRMEAMASPSEVLAASDKAVEDLIARNALGASGVRSPRSRRETY